MTGEADPEQLQASVDLMNEMAAAAPEEIRDDFQILADAYSQIVTIFAGGEFDPDDPMSMDLEMLAELEALSEGMDQAAIAEASANVSQFFLENCSTP